MSSYSVREIEAGDAEQLSFVHVTTWKVTYPGMVNQTKLDALEPSDRISRWEEKIANLDRQAADGVHTRCAIYLPTGQIIGFATGGTSRDSDAPASTELWSLNVLPQHHGSGVAATLMNTVIGGGAACLWVATGNARAVAFYRKHGFELDGITRFDPNWDCHESRMVTGRYSRMAVKSLTFTPVA